MMYDHVIYSETLPEAYHEALKTLNRYGQLERCSDWNCSQLEIPLTMFVMYPLREPMISLCSYTTPEDLQQYIYEICDGLLDFEVGAGKLPYTYHNRMVEPVDQIAGVIAELKRNPDSRRACITIRRPEDIFSADPPCLQHIQYFIRGGKLDCFVLFRSNDACKATFTNAFGLIFLQRYIAGQLGVQVGTYTHRANSFHCYERDFDLLKGYVARIRSNSNSTASYKGDWKEMMNDSIPAIKQKIDALKCITGDMKK